VFTIEGASMLRNILRTTDDKVIALLRIVLGIVVFPHGAQKVLGWWGGFGFSGTLGFLTQQMHIPTALALLVFAAEFLGALGLILGFLGRIAAFGIAVDFLVAVFLVHLPNGFFMNWSGQQKGEGIEFFILTIGIAIAVMIRGSGAMSVDRALAQKTAP
jgi:putative oxidoreductase